MGRSTKEKTTNMDHAKNVLDTGMAMADAIKHVIDLETRRHTVKMACIDRIMKAGDNPLTGKPHSFSSAEAAVGTDAEYIRYLDELSLATHAKIAAEVRYEAARTAARHAA